MTCSSWSVDGYCGLSPGETVPQLSGIAALDAKDVCDLDRVPGLSSGMGETKEALE